MYLNNPCGQAHTFVARLSDSREIVGCVSIFPRRMVVSGRKYLAGITGDFAVNKNIRGFLGFQLQQRAIEYAKENFDFIYSIPNPQSELIMERVGYVKVDDISRIANILWADKKLKKVINPLLARIIAPLINIYLQHNPKSKKTILKADLSEEAISFFDERFDNFWNEVLSQSKLIGVRDAKYLNWKFCSSPYCKHHIFALTHKQTSELKGFIVYHLKEYRCVIDDLQFSSWRDIHILLMGRFLWHLRQRKKVNVVSMFTTNTNLSRELGKTLGFIERDTEDKLMLYLPPKSAGLSECLHDPKSWNIFKADWDI